MPTNANYRRDKIPMWINILSGIVVLILVFKTYSAFANPSLAYGAIEGNVLANQKVLWELAGRNIAMIVATVLALRSQNAMFLAFTMMINLVREGFDMFMGIRFSGGDMGQIMQAGSFLVFLIPYFIALGKLRKLAALPE
ncbi:MAG: hypothetical protein KIPDCIKN_04144 [Haliscomenobacter sp.]|jgi:hypothetical protein|nr:hypothetical protein [Haliscomenobacter sp.]